jgi:hypothetical protein
MSWLEENEYVFKFKCPQCEREEGIISKDKNFDKSYLPWPCRDDDLDSPSCELTYVGFELAEPLGLVTKISYDQAGHLAVKTSDGKGNNFYKSQTRINFEKTGSTEAVVTKEYKEHVAKTFKPGEHSATERLIRTQVSGLKNTKKVIT